ncbi:DUF6000 family protein [Streptomyces yangpuensis]|uniref:DUF6000 family protein n=1 Tax=Streptomyces yangpuensis TaxID=1648182 RepID=UPI00381FC220
MPFQHREEIGYDHVIERYVPRKDPDHPRHLALKSGRALRPRGPHAERFTRQLIDDAATITAARLIGVDRCATFRERVGDLLLASGFCFSRSAYCFTLARFGTHADAEILTTYLDRYLPRTAGTDVAITSAATQLL